MARFQLEPNAVPLHRQVYADLRSAIEAGEWRPGERVTPERELAERYGCSLITVRRALTDLAREHRVVRARGRGTFVAEPPIERDLAGTLSFADEMLSRGKNPRTRVVTARTEPAGAAVGQALGIGVEAPVIYLERLRVADGEPLILEQVRLAADAFPDLVGADLENGSLYALLLERFGIRMARVREWLEAVALPRREARLLGIDAGQPALRIEGVGFDQADRPVEHAVSFIRGDRTRYYVERVVVRSGLQAGGRRTLGGRVVRPPRSRTARAVVPS